MLFQTTRSGETFGIEAIVGKDPLAFSDARAELHPFDPRSGPNGKAIYVPGVDGKVHELKAATGHEIHANGFPAKITLVPATEANESPLNIANGYLYATISGYNGDGTPYDGHVVAINLSSGKRSVFNSLCSNKHKLLAGSGAARSARASGHGAGQSSTPIPR